MNPTPQQPAGQAQGSGCIPLVMMGIGILLAIVSVLGFIAGLFDYRLVINRAELPLINLEVLLPLLVVAIFFFAIGYGIDVLAARMRRRKAQRKQQN